jgi:LacI family transcriptional regulator
VTVDQSKRTKPTIETVARRAGVSRQTVSNVIRNPERVRAETRDRVRRAIDDLRYRPNRLARALQAQATRTLAYRCHEAGENENLLLDRFLHDLCRAAARRDYHIVLISPVDLTGELSDYDTLFHSGTVDGFVLSGTAPGDPRLHQLTSEHIPFVSFGRNWDDPGASTWVDVDGAAGTAEATRYFSAAGHRRIAWLGGVNAVGAALDRQLGYRRAIAEAGSEPLLFECLDAIEAAEATALRVLDRDDAPTAFVCASDLLALGCAGAAEERGLKLGTELGITGFDDSRLATAHLPPLSSIRQPTAEVADVLVDSFVRAHVDGDDVASVLLAPTLVHRGST